MKFARIGQRSDRSWLLRQGCSDIGRGRAQRRQEIGHRLPLSKPADAIAGRVALR
jgi:hypothetical protein